MSKDPDRADEIAQFKSVVSISLAPGFSQVNHDQISAPETVSTRFPSNHAETISHDECTSNSFTQGPWHASQVKLSCIDLETVNNGSRYHSWRFYLAKARCSNGDELEVEMNYFTNLQELLQNLRDPFLL